MKNLREKFRKIKFLVPLVVGAILLFLIKDTDLFDSVMVICISIVAVFAALHQWRMTYDEKYKEKKVKFFEEERRKPWHDRIKYVKLSSTMRGMLLVCPIIFLVSISGFFWTGFSTGIWDQSFLNSAIFFLIIFLFSYKALKNKNSPWK